MERRKKRGEEELEVTRREEGRARGKGRRKILEKQMAQAIQLTSQ